MSNTSRWRIFSAGILAAALAATSLTTSASTARADPTFTATIVNSTPTGDQVLRLDAEGDAVDVHEGELLAAPDGSYWWYGQSYDCGYILKVASPWCGLRAYRSVDLLQWHDMGLMVAPDATWTPRCEQPHYGCFSPHVLYRPATSDYLMWVNTYDGTSGYRLLTAPAPGGPWTELAGEPTLAHMGAAGGLNNGDADEAIDPDTGQGWIAYTDIIDTHTIVVEALNGDYTSGTGAAINVTGTLMEAPALFKHGTTWYLVYGPVCEYCSGVATYVRTASTPAGPWSAQSTLAATGCSGQVSWIADIGGVPVLALNQWQNHAPNEALANHYWTPLTFTGTTLNPFTCSEWANITVPGALAWEPPPAGLDQTSGGYAWRTYCDVKATANSRLEPFIAGRSGILAEVGIMSYRAVTAPNAGLKVEVVILSSDLVPSGPPLASATFAAVGWSPALQRFSPNAPVRAGVRYGLVLSSASTTGCYGIAYNYVGQYDDGRTARKGTTGGWIVETPRSLAFYTKVT